MATDNLTTPVDQASAWGECVTAAGDLHALSAAICNLLIDLPPAPSWDGEDAKRRTLDALGQALRLADLSHRIAATLRDNVDAIQPSARP